MDHKLEDVEVQPEMTEEIHQESGDRPESSTEEQGRLRVTKKVETYKPSVESVRSGLDKTRGTANSVRFWRRRDQTHPRAYHKENGSASQQNIQSCNSTGKAPQQKYVSEASMQLSIVQGLIKGSVPLSSWCNDQALAHIYRVCASAQDMLRPHI
jgi:hypothetical protein